MSAIKIACLCPTYKRPECLVNAAACFLGQDIRINYLDACRLFILDDANQYDNRRAGRDDIELKSQCYRYPSLPEKYHALVEMANKWGATAYAIWEDDDVFLPWHLSNILRAFEDGVQYYRTSQVWSTYGKNKRGMALEGAAGRFHSSWAFTRDLYEKIGGYMGIRDANSDAPTKHLNFDQRLGSALAAGSGDGFQDDFPGYVYRWGNVSYHGSASGDGGYQALWDRLGGMEAPHMGALAPRFDAETILLNEKGLRKYADHLLKN